MQTVPLSSVDKTVPSACLGCRLRRHKCGREKPMCLNCVDLKGPSNMCLYRSVGLISKDSKSTLQSLKDQNVKLKQQVVELEELVKKRKLHPTEGTTGSKDYKLRKSSDVTNCYKHFQLNPQKNSLSHYIKETNLGLTHYGSFSIDALTNSEPSLKQLIKQIDIFIKRERLKYDAKMEKIRNGTVENDENLKIIKCKLLEKRLGLTQNKDVDLEILELIIKGVEKILPDSNSLEMLLTPYFRHYKDRCVAFVYFDEESVRESINSFLDVSAKRPKININLPKDVDKLPGLLQFISILIFLLFIVSVTLRSQ